MNCRSVRGETLATCKRAVTLQLPEEMVAYVDSHTGKGGRSQYIRYAVEEQISEGHLRDGPASPSRFRLRRTPRRLPEVLYEGARAPSKPPHPLSAVRTTAAGARAA